MSKNDGSSSAAEAAQLDRADVAVAVLVHEQQVDHPHEAPQGQVPQRRRDARR